MAITKSDRRNRIKLGTRRNLAGTAEVPRVSVFRSNKSIYAQIIDDNAGHTLVAASSNDLKKVGSTVSQSKEVGMKLAEKAKAAGIEKVVFDRSGYKYHGRVKALAEGAREGGLKF